MQLKGLLTKLGYQDSPNFLRAADPHTQTVPDYGHVFRKATTRPGLHGVYVLRPDQIGTKPGNSVVPVVYVCEAQTEPHAEEIHRLVWNQDVVPFIIVYSPQGVRLYSGFRYHRPSTGGTHGLQEGVLRVLTDFYRIDELVEGFSAEAIDSGAIWRQWGKAVEPEQRLERSLLRNLRELDKWLRNKAHLAPEVSHALIGKYVYLHYLRDRNILSDQKLQRFDVAKSDIFGRTAKLPAIRKIIDYLEDWLNGSVFPLTFTGSGAPTEDDLRHVAGVFSGDEIQQDGSSQLHLDFKAYDFSYIPIETLSIVYEQFLHAKVEEGKPTKAKEAGAYYTPIPLVNFMLAKLEDRHPLQQGMRVFDPSCGSGAFLVQCYRRLIEKTFPPSGPHPSPGQLRDILEKHIFGVDRDADACSVTELSLILTLLDYVNPPDLENGSRQQFNLPSLRGQNIHQADFFNTQGDWHGVLTRKKFDWIVGNPPWKKLNPAKLRNDDQPAWQWMVKLKNKTNRPVGKYEVGQAFAWEIGDYLAKDGVAAMLLPAMGLFEEPSRAFRAAFFQTLDVHAVANFSNLAEVLFAGRSRVPAAAFFYSPRPTRADRTEDSHIEVYSPLVANQEATRPLAPGTRKDTWNLILNASELRSIRTAEAASGSALPWKLAAWGSEFDRKLLARLRRQLPSLGKLEDRGLLVISQGLELRPAPSKDAKEQEDLEPIPDIQDKKTIDMERLRETGRLFVFPTDAIVAIDHTLTHGRKRAGITLPLSVCRPPHVIVSAARNFAIYSDQYLVVPARQIGIISPTDNRPLLKALSLYLSSDFAFYHQFFTSTQFGVQRGLATLGALRKIPCPLDRCSPTDLSAWATLHDQIAEASAKRVAASDAAGTLFEETRPGDEFAQLMDELDSRVADLLGLTDREQALVADFVGIRYALNDGKLGPAAVHQPTQAQLKTYARRLKSELDTFVEGVLPKRHDIGIVYDKLSASAMVSIDLTKNANAGNALIVAAADSQAGKELERTRRRLQQKRSQWVYFNRDLRIFEGTRTYLFKPMQRFHWTETQAMIDAAEVISATLASGGGKS